MNKNTLARCASRNTLRNHASIHRPAGCEPDLCAVQPDVPNLHDRSPGAWRSDFGAYGAAPRRINLAIYRAGYPSLPQAGWGTPEHVVLPVLVLAAANIGYIARLTRSSMLEVLRDDYVRTARAKGLPAHTVVLRHVLRNALLPIL